jgi:segregation and condensation protein A
MANEVKSDRIGNDHLYDLLIGREVSWQAIIYDLINSGQLNPWDIDLSILANRYLVKIRELEEANFFISSKVLLAASLILRIKSEILLNDYISSIDDILFGKKDKENKPMERIELDENELPSLYPKTPMPRMRKVSLQELMAALGKAINTENRRIKREIVEKQLIREAEVVMPKASRVNIKDRIRKIYSRILTMAKSKQTRISYSELVGNDREERRACFLPCLHLDNQQKVWLEQEKHFAEIYVWLYSHYKSQNQVSSSVREMMEEVAEEIEASEENPLGGFFNGFETLGIENEGN